MQVYFRKPFLQLWPCLLCLFLFLSGIQAETERKPPGIGIEEKLGDKLPEQLVFLDEDGAKVQIEKNFLDARLPVILVPSYYTCTRLCSFIFQGLQKGLDAMTKGGVLLPGRDYRVLSISINPRDNPQSSKEKGDMIRSQFRQLPIASGRKDWEENWRFLSSAQDSDESRQAAPKLMDALGYRYKKDDKDFSHTAAIVILSPDGRIMRYLYGLEFPEQSLRLALVEASRGKIGGAVEKILLYCFRYDPIEGKYTPFAMAFIRIGGALTLLFLGLMWFVLGYKKRRQA